MKRGFRLAVCQMNVVEGKGKNIAKAVEMLEKAAEGKADIAVLPEMFNCPYDNSRFEEYSESAADGETVTAISKKAAELGIYVFGGSIPERDNGHIYNTCLVFDRGGRVIGKHRKMHLFDIDVAGRIRFMESDVLSPGSEVTVVDTEFCKIGAAVCYDIRFPELSRLMVMEGAEVLIFPAAFNMVTGPAHWELLIRMRALDNQAYVAAVSPARNPASSYTAYGNSMIASPWGNVIKRAGEGEEIFFTDIDPIELERIRNELPLLKQRRTDIYSLEKNDVIKG